MLIKHGYAESDIFYESNVYLAAIGSEIAFVAHVDTVWELNPHLTLKQEAQSYINTEEATGMGADDRLGICALEDLLDEHPFFHPTIFLCNFEEVGGLGAQILNETFYMPNFECKALIELDRRGKNDAVFYHEPTELFRKIVLKNGFIEQQGSFSDISFLNTNYSLMFAPSVNLSIGYMYEHTCAERIIIPWYEEALNRIFYLYVDLMTEKGDYRYASKRRYSQIFGFPEDSFDF